MLDVGPLGAGLLLHSWARNRLVEMWSRRQETQRAETSPEVNNGMCSRRGKCDKRHLTDRKPVSKSVHSLLVAYGKTEMEKVVSSLAVAPWLSLHLSCDYPNSALLSIGHGPCSGALFSLILPVSVMCWQIFRGWCPPAQLQ